MVAIILIIIVVSGMAYPDLYGLYHNKDFKELGVVIGTYLCALVLSSLYALKVDIPTPLEGLSILLDPLYEFIHNLFT